MRPVAATACLLHDFASVPPATNRGAVPCHTPWQEIKRAAIGGVAQNTPLP